MNARIIIRIRCREVPFGSTNALHKIITPSELACGINTNVCPSLAIYLIYTFCHRRVHCKQIYSKQLNSSVLRRLNQLNSLARINFVRRRRVIYPRQTDLASETCWLHPAIMIFGIKCINYGCYWKDFCR